MLSAISLNALSSGSLAVEQAKPLTKPKLFTFGIEGPAVGPDGTLYVPNLHHQGTIAEVKNGEPSLIFELPSGSIGNAIRFAPSGEMMIADYKGHHVYGYDLKTKKLTAFCTESKMHQPNDITIARDGTIYASDPSWKQRSGQIWKIHSDGQAALFAKDLGTTNGIDLSVDDRTLYVGESFENRIYAYPVGADGVGPRRLVIQFKDFSIDGLRTDAVGHLWVTRIGKGTVAEISPEGTLIREVRLNGKDPTNLAFGGPDGRTVFVAQRDGGFIETFQAENPGREWLLGSVCTFDRERRRRRCQAPKRSACQRRSSSKAQIASP